MTNEETVWTNQTLFSHKDNEFNTNSVIETSLVISTQDLKNFSSPFINVSITNLNDKKRRVCTLNMQVTNSIIKRFDIVCSDTEKYYDNEDFFIIEKLNNKELQIMFKRSKINPLQKCVIISIIINPSDYGLVILNFDTARLFFESLKVLYDRVVISLLYNRSLLTALLDKLDEVNRNIKSLPSLITVFPETHKKIVEEADQSSVYKELDEYIGGTEIANIRVPEFENGIIEAEGKQAFHSHIVNDVLDNDITNIESLVHSSYVTSKPVLSILESIKHRLKNIPDDFEFLPGITEQEFKSLLYLSKLFFSHALHNYTLNGVSFPLGSPLLCFTPDPSRVKELNTDLALDLLLIVAYFKALKERLSQKVEDANLNKSLVYYALRCFVDVLIFSFLKVEAKDTVTSLIKRNFKAYCDQGFFKKYEALLERYGCSGITFDDITKFVDGVFSKLPQKLNICETQDFLYSNGDVILPSNNELRDEQIIEEVVRLEVASKLGADLSKQEEIVKWLGKAEVSDEVLRVFHEKRNRKLADRKREAPIYKYIKKYENEIPESFRSDFMKHIYEISTANVNFDFSQTTFPLEQLGEHIIKGLYEYNESSKKEAYNNFFMRAEECMLTKEMILVKTRAKEADKSIDWGSLTST